VDERARQGKREVPRVRWPVAPDPRGHVLLPDIAQILRGGFMKLEGKRIAILAENMYQEMELWVPYYRLREEGADVKIIGAGNVKSYTSKHGYPVNVDAQAEQVRAVEFDAVIVPGGYAPDMMRRHDRSEERRVGKEEGI